ncbi:hypothetical protein HO173_005119 [Letharia columbiana]|uniref:Uncharacterized protein n=1 Tax=Letharia columbiana TaxID=112416 RepID=A0A8H6L5W8_9LECA|nr:uncharacterized protein HO173_005119 [Letharia columbiana]KAF6236828.1 hypothetical protein HO173_005119 [Letharia columbiana]
MAEEVAEQEKVRADREKSLRAQLSNTEAMEEAHATELENLLHDVGGVVFFRAILGEDEVTVSFTTITKSQEAVVTIHHANRRKLVWHEKLEKCVVTIKSWEWILCLDQGSGRPGIHLHHMMEHDVAELPSSLRQNTERGACYCREPGV